MNFLRSSLKVSRNTNERSSPTKEAGSSCKSPASPTDQVVTPSKKTSTPSHKGPSPKSQTNPNRRISASKKIRSIQWSDPMDNSLVDTLVEQVNLGLKSDIGFKPKAYEATIKKIHERCQILLENRHISNHLHTLKRLYWAIKDMLSACDFGWDPDEKMIVASDDVWEGYIASHPYAERVYKKHIERYDDLAFIFDNECAHDSFANTAYSSPISGRRRSRRELNSDDGSEEEASETVHLSSNYDDDQHLGPHICCSERSTHRSKRYNRSPMETTTRSRNSHSTASDMSRQRKGKPSDHIGDKIGEMAEAVKSLTITMSQGKSMSRLQRLLGILKEVEGLSHEDQLRAAGFFMKMGHERRNEWIQKQIIERSGPE